MCTISAPFWDANIGNSRQYGLAMALYILLRVANHYKPIYIAFTNKHTESPSKYDHIYTLRPSPSSRCVVRSTSNRL
jgi:hypothetical protein